MNIHMKKGNLLVGQSGGPTAVINASLCGVVEAALEADSIDKIYGSVHGIEGVLKEHFTLLSDTFANKWERELLLHTPASYLGSCRYKLPSSKEEPGLYETIFSIFQKYNICCFLYIGGNDSMDTVYQLSEYAKEHGHDVSIVGVPKTIDNDLAMTDHCPGYGSAAKMIATTIKEIARDCAVYDLDSVTIVEIMGRNAGWLTAASALARCQFSTAPDLIYLPETPFSMEEFLEDTYALVQKQKVVVIAVSEGIQDDHGRYICDIVGNEEKDSFGHQKLSGCAKVLEWAVKEKIGCKVRSVELNVSQRCACHIASLTDITEARDIGYEAATAAIAGTTGKMMAYKRREINPYHITIEPVDIASVANIEKRMPQEMIVPRGNDITEAFLNYVEPLILGEAMPVYEGGIPKHICLQK